MFGKKKKQEAVEGQVVIQKDQDENKEEKVAFADTDVENGDQAPVPEEKTKEHKVKEKKRKHRNPWRVRRVMIGCGWIVLIGSLIWSVYNHFTVVNEKVITEKETIIEKVQNFAGVESFVNNFAWTYFSYQSKGNGQVERMETLSKYMSQELLELNRTSLEKTDVRVTGVQVWNIEPLTSENEDFEVLLSVTQYREETDTTEYSAYTVQVHVEGQNYVITKNPTITSTWQTAEYKKEAFEATDNLAVEDREAVEVFLETFFKVYPISSEKELAYYVKDAEVRPIWKEWYNLQSVDNLKIRKTGKGEYTVVCDVLYLDTALNTRVLNQYEMDLATQEDGELIIVEMR